MFAAGVIEEVEQADIYSFSRTCAKMLGVGEILSILDGQMTIEQAIGSIQQATRRYAKRQCTWFRKKAEYRRVAMG